MVTINLTDYWRFLVVNRKYLASEYPDNINIVMSRYPSMELVNGRDFGAGIRLSEQDAIMFKLRYA